MTEDVWANNITPLMQLNTIIILKSELQMLLEQETEQNGARARGTRK